MVILSAYTVAGDLLVKKASTLSGMNPFSIKTLPYFALSFFVYATTAFGWYYILKVMKLATCGVVYAVSTVLFVVIGGVFIFKEPLNGYEIIGIALAVLSLLLLTRFS